WFVEALYFEAALLVHVVDPQLVAAERRDGGALCIRARKRDRVADAHALRRIGGKRGARRPDDTDRRGQCQAAQFATHHIPPSWITAAAIVPRSERIWIGLVLDRHPLPARELLPVGRTAHARAGASRAGAAERNVWLVGHGLVVDVEQARAQPVAERERAAGRLGEHAG